MAGNEFTQFGCPQIAIGLSPRDKTKALATGSADSRSHKSRVLEQMGDLARMRSERQGLSSVHETRGELLDAFSGQGSSEPRPNARINLFDLFARGQ
jgi:hypothetical protein